jgi:hypothetical protein
MYEYHSLTKSQQRTLSQCYHVGEIAERGGNADYDSRGICSEAVRHRKADEDDEYDWETNDQSHIRFRTLSAATRTEVNRVADERQRWIDEAFVPRGGRGPRRGDGLTRRRQGV